MTTKSPHTAADFAEIPLAIGSFIFFKAIKVVLRAFVALINRVRRGKATAWRVVSGELIKKPLMLPVFMTKAPRWNTHAIIGMAGPLAVKSSIAVNVAQATSSATAWCLVVQPLGAGRESRISSLDEEKGVTWKSTHLPPGYYMLVMRYYGQSAQASLPAIKVDEQEIVDTRQIDENNNQFYGALRQRKNWFYLSLNYYVFTMLRFLDWLPNDFVTREYLPAGDPGMKFKYGAIRRGAALKVTLQKELLNAYDVYLSLYDRASFPVQWQRIEDEEYTSVVLEENGYYLMRLLLKPGVSEEPIDQLVKVSAVAA